VEVCDDQVGVRKRAPLRVVALDQYDSATRTPARLHIPPTIPNHHALLEVDVPLAGSVDEQTRQRLTAAALIRVVVRADPNIVERQPPAQLVIDRLDALSRLPAASNIGLIADDHQQEARLVQTLARLDRSGITVKSSFDVKPGTYLVRLVVRDKEGELMAARNGAVVIPY